MVCRLNHFVDRNWFVKSLRLVDASHEENKHRESPIAGSMPDKDGKCFAKAKVLWPTSRCTFQTKIHVTSAADKKGQIEMSRKELDA